MNLEEVARLIPDMARQVNPDHLPFLDAADQVIAGMAEITKSIEDPKAAELMRQMLAEINDARGEFLRVVPPAIAEMRTELIQSADEYSSELIGFNKTHAEAVASLDELQASLPARMEAARAEMLASIPKPPPAPEPVAINPGEELVARLMDLGNPAPRARAPYTLAPPSPDKPSGFVARYKTSNIWENWKQGPGKT